MGTKQLPVGGCKDLLLSINKICVPENVKNLKKL